MNKSSIYVIWMEGTPYYKIGRAKNVRARLKTLQTASPFDLYVVFKQEMLTSIAIGVEYELHNQLEDAKIRGEWYALDNWQRGYIEHRIKQLVKKHMRMLKENLE